MKTLFYNGKIYTGELPLVEAFAMEGDRILAAGSLFQVEKTLCNWMTTGEALERVDLGGAFVMSGFNDSHMHLLGLGQMLNSAPMAEYTDSLAGLISKTRAFFEEHPVADGAWMVGRGWNHDYFQDVKRLPDRDDLDQISKEHPVCAVRCCGHALVVNSKALELLGITAKTPNPVGGKIGIRNVSDVDGRKVCEPDGRFFDNAMQLVYSKIPLPTKETIKNYIKSACRALNSYGVTSSQTDDYCCYRELPWQVVNAAYEELEAEGELTVRVFEQANLTSLAALKNYVEAGNVTGKGSSFFQIGPLKMLGDGSLGARTAYLTKPYEDAPDVTGIPVFPPQVFDEMISYANRHEMSVAIHAIGDACLDDVLSAIENALREHPREDHRHGIVHCQITRPDQLDKIAELKLHVYAQSIFLDYDIHIIEDRVGKERAASSYSWKTLMDKGVSVSNGTDCPVEMPNALGGIQCAVTRKTLKEKIGPYLPEQAFSVKEALDSYTIRSAEASFEEKIKGKLLPGYFADFVVLGGNPFEAEPENIKDIPVLATYVGGRKVFQHN